MEENEKTKQVIIEQEEEQQLWSWGAGTDGQLGTDRPEDEHLPQLLHLPSLSISSLSCGGAHVLSLTSGGKVFTWGRGTSGQLGHSDTVNSLIPKLVSSLDGYSITHVSAGWSHSGFVSDNGSVFTCGDGLFGQLGHGDYASQCFPVKVSYFVGKHVEQIACGMRHSLVLLKDCSGNQVYGFGSGKRGQLGISKDRIKSVCLPHLTRGFEDVEIINITANGDHSAAISADGHLYTWGRGFSGSSDASLPQCVPSSLRFTSTALGWNHALVLTDYGEVFMLGGTHHGILSDPEKMSLQKNLSVDSGESPMEKVSGCEGERIVQIAAGAEHSAFVTENGILKTWGWGEHGQLGLASTCDQSAPTTVCLGDEDAAFRVYCGSGFTFAIRTLKP